MEARAFFGYACPECGQGTVQATKFQNYKTKIKGYPFTVKEAVIGVCSNCKARHFTAKETKRWEEAFYRSLEDRRIFCSPQAITRLRDRLGLSMEDFARLIGCTRQSIYNWEKRDRTSQPSRMADLLMKLVEQSYISERVDVISFLLKEAERLGTTIELQRSPMNSKNAEDSENVIHLLDSESRYSDSEASLELSQSLETSDNIILLPQRTKKSSISESPNEQSLAADADSADEEIFMGTSSGDAIGSLEYDYAEGALYFRTENSFPPWETVDARIETQYDKIDIENRPVSGNLIVLQDECKDNRREITRIMLKPHKGTKRQTNG